MKVFKKLFVATTVFTCVACGCNTEAWSDDEVIYRDVAIIGGGSSGSYTAVKLRDQNYSVAVIEPKSHLGGHAETFTTPKGWTIDIGVVVFDPIETVESYFSRFNVSLVPLNAGGQSPRPLIDFSTGQTATDIKASSPEEVSTGLANYAKQLAKYPYLDLGFNLTYPIPEDSDLLIPFGEFAAKYNLSGAMPLVFTTNQGYVPLLNITTLYMLKYLNKYELDSFADHFLTTENHNIQQLYQSIATFLGPENVFLNTTVISTDRTTTPIKIKIQTPTGQKQIVAKQVVITAPPTLDNLRPIDLTATEVDLFSQFFANGYYTGLLTNTSVPANYSAQASDPYNTASYNFPTFPGLYSITSVAGATDYIQVYYGSPTVLPPEQVQADIVETVKRVQRAQGWADTEPQWAVFSAHTPFNCMVNPEAIRDGFYAKAIAMQGRNGTWWNGAAWEAQDSSMLWRYTDKWVVPEVVEALQAMA